MIRIFIAFVIFLFSFSCETVKNAGQTQNGPEPEIWEEGISTLSGIITKVVQEKDGQTVTLKTGGGIEYICVISVPNLGDDHGRYREFKPGENITFRGNLSTKNRMTVREVLENR